MTTAPSLFDPYSAPVLPAASDWVTGSLLGSVAISLCVIAIAFVGLRMMTGHFAVRDGLRVVAACFVLLGASTIATGLRGAAGEISPASVAEPVQAQAFPETAPLPPSNYDPYAGASLRRPR